MANRAFPLVLALLWKVCPACVESISNQLIANFLNYSETICAYKSSSDVLQSICFFLTCFFIDIYFWKFFIWSLYCNYLKKNIFHIICWTRRSTFIDFTRGVWIFTFQVGQTSDFLSFTISLILYWNGLLCCNLNILL